MADPNMSAEFVETWITSRAHNCYVVIAGLLGGGDRGHLIAGNLALAAFVVITAMSLRFVFREVTGVAAQVWTIGLTLLKIVLGIAVVTFLAVWTGRLYSFVYPGPAAQHVAAAKHAAEEAVQHGTWRILDWWRQNTNSSL